MSAPRWHEFPDEPNTLLDVARDSDALGNVARIIDVLNECNRWPPADPLRERVTHRWPEWFADWIDEEDAAWAGPLTYLPSNLPQGVHHAPH